MLGENCPINFGMKLGFLLLLSLFWNDIDFCIKGIFLMNILSSLQDHLTANVAKNSLERLIEGFCHYNQSLHFGIEWFVRPKRSEEVK